MEVRKLYYEDPHLREFTARVESCEPAQKGWHITLNATAFYPEGGGQACDLGTLNDAHVLDVREQGAQVVHLCDRPLPAGTTVHGVIDWQRRFDLMQQHTGEHILSGLIYDRFGWQNVGFHVGKEAMEVDFDGPIPPDALWELEAAANRAIWENRPVLCSIPSPEALAALTYRTKRALPWPVRIVEVQGYDRCACCGVHTAFTGEVGLIKILSCAKFHGGVRLEMLCGQRAYDYLCRIYNENRQISQLLSARPLETGAAVQKLQESLASEKFRATGLEKQVFSAIAEGCAGKENVLYAAENLTPGAVRELADRIGKQCTGIAAVCSGSDDAGYSLCLVSQSADVRPLGTQAAAALQGRGGGKPGAFQGSFRANREQIISFFSDIYNFFVISPKAYG